MAAGWANGARFTPDIPAIRDAGLTTQAEVLAFARLAADAVWATPMDRPEWATVGPEGDVYMALTNNRARTAPDAANPVAPNPDGHILRWRDTFEHTGDVFVWEIFRIAADTHGGEESFSAPDGLWADPDGRLFIQTDGDQQDGMNNQMLVADAATGALRRLFSGRSRSRDHRYRDDPRPPDDVRQCPAPRQWRPRADQFPCRERAAAPARPSRAMRPWR